MFIQGLLDTSVLAGQSNVALASQYQCCFINVHI